MRLALAVLVCCTTAWAAVGAAISHSGTPAFLERRTPQSEDQENKIYVESSRGQSTRKSLLSALGLLGTVASAAGIAVLVWTCFVGNKREESNKNHDSRPAEKSKLAKHLEVSGLRSLTPAQLMEKACDMVNRAMEILAEDEYYLFEVEERLLGALQRVEELQAAAEDPGRSKKGTRDKEVAHAAAKAHEALTVLGYEPLDFPQDHSPFFFAVKFRLKKDRREQELRWRVLEKQRNAWEDAQTRLWALQEAVFALQSAQNAAVGSERDAVEETQAAVDVAARDLVSALMDAVGINEMEYFE